MLTSASIDAAVGTVAAWQATPYALAVWLIARSLELMLLKPNAAFMSCSFADMVTPDGLYPTFWNPESVVG